MEEDIKNIERVIDYIQLESPIIQGLGNAIYTDSLKRLIKGYRDGEDILKNITKENLEYRQYIRELELENQALENTKNTCPNMATSGIRCDAKEKLKELEKSLDNSRKANELLNKTNNELRWEIRTTYSKAVNDIISKFNLGDDFIPKSKAKEMIEQLDYRCNSNLERVYKKEILQELMEDK